MYTYIQVKARVNEIDTTKIKENLAKARDSASETIAAGRVVAEAHLQESDPFLAFPPGCAYVKCQNNCIAAEGICPLQTKTKIVGHDSHCYD